MDTTIKNAISYLQNYVGQEIIRKKPIPIQKEEWKEWKGLQSDWRHTKTPIILLGFTKEGGIRYQYTEEGAKINGYQEQVLPLCFTDENWITYKEALEPKNNALNKWIGKRIKRKRSTCLGDRSYMDKEYEKAPILLSASEYHMLIQYDIGTKTSTCLLGPTFVSPEDWELA